MTIITPPLELEDHEASVKRLAPGVDQRLHPNGQRAVAALRLFAVVMVVWLLSCMLVIVPAGSRGVLLRFGAIQTRELREGLHVLIPAIDSLQLMGVRMHSDVLRTEAACKDLQDVAVETSVHWHLPSDRVVQVYRWIGDDSSVSKNVITPALEDGLKQVVAAFSAEQLVSERIAVKEALEAVIGQRLNENQLVLDGIDLLQVDFSDRFKQAVEAKQVAEQDARRAAFLVEKARRLAEARIQRAQGEARAQQILQQGLSPEVLQHQAIEKWNGHLPLVMDSNSVQTYDLGKLAKIDRKRAG